MKGRTNTRVSVHNEIRNGEDAGAGEEDVVAQTLEDAGAGEEDAVAQTLEDAGAGEEDAVAQTLEDAGAGEEDAVACRTSRGDEDSSGIATELLLFLIRRRSVAVVPSFRGGASIFYRRVAIVKRHPGDTISGDSNRRRVVLRLFSGSFSIAIQDLSPPLVAAHRRRLLFLSALQPLCSLIPATKPLYRRYVPYKHRWRTLSTLMRRQRWKRRYKNQ
ncbi:hypothetical protein LXL04_037689 [Taraxacum kok-saghyz]